jgi:hypothetical protein
VRTLSKSDFKIARTCDAKLYFRENGYPTNLDTNEYLQLLARGGYMVEALAKAKHPNGIQLDYGSGIENDFKRTKLELEKHSVTLFEATLLVGRRHARVDILEKFGDIVRIYEVKAKSFDGIEHERLLAEGKPGSFRSSRRPFPISSDWSEKLEDITFQVLLLEKVLPGVVIEPYLVLVDKSKSASIDNVPTLFELDYRQASNSSLRLHSAKYVGTPEQLNALDLLTSVNVAVEVALLRDEVEASAVRFESLLDAPLTIYLDELVRTSECAHCEFRVGDDAPQNGFNDCWGPLAKPRPHLVELNSVGTAKAPDGTPLIEWMVREGRAALLDVPTQGLVKRDGTIGPQAQRQLRQIDYTRRNELYVGSGLRAKIEALRGPMHFIDFETSRLALPYHSGMRPYGLVTFQWSCHTVEASSLRPIHVDWLNTSELWPNQTFAESLRQAIGDHGPVLTWSPFESVTLKQIIDDLAKFGRDVPDLVEWMKDVFENRIVDMHEWARNDFYHPGMRGQTSIKVVLDALWRTDARMRAQFEEWTGSTADGLIDPYASLPAIEIAGSLQHVREGTGAMLAYEAMMYGPDRHDPERSAQWATLLRQYCALDTLSMVLILEYWRRQFGL